ncbi:uncharacterized protein LOC128955527 [Oppia nitens]|uniref:uncharacterized protein LOC128955527 n=1 Tax=Oppia nitens TaxID=1686743 RepID=UPI0023DA44CF|nr:uncharacterized protein LOC128955527 [Oppia nitens]
MYRYCNRHGLTVITAAAIVGCHHQWWWWQNSCHKHRDIVDTLCPNELSTVDDQQQQQQQQYGQTVDYRLMKMVHMTNEKYSIDVINKWMETKFLRVRSPNYQKIVSGSMGTGIIVNFRNKPLIITNEHVTRGHQFVDLKCNHETEKRIGLVVYKNPELDLALIYVSTLEFGRMLGCCTIDTVNTEHEFGDEVISLGFSQKKRVINMGYGHVVCTDTFAPKISHDIFNVIPDCRYVVHTAGQYPGFSGGPTVNLSGKLIAVNSIGSLSNECNYSIHFNQIENFVDTGTEFYYQQIARRDRNHSVRLGLSLQWSTYYGLNGLMVNEKFCQTLGNQNLNRFDIIAEINGQQIRSLDQFMYELSRFPDNNNIPVLIRNFSGGLNPQTIRVQQLYIKWV